MFLWAYTVGIVHCLVSNASWWQNAVRCWRTQISGKSFFGEWKVLIWTHAYLLKDWTWIGHFTTCIFEEIIKSNRSNLLGYSHSNKLTASHGFVCNRCYLEGWQACWWCLRDSWYAACNGKFCFDHAAPVAGILLWTLNFALSWTHVFQ